jgi:hypothetical protein
MSFNDDFGDFQEAQEVQVEEKPVITEPILKIDTAQIPEPIKILTISVIEP